MMIETILLALIGVIAVEAVTHAYKQHKLRTTWTPKR